MSINARDANAGEDGLGGLVRRVLRDELAAYGTLENGSSQRSNRGEPLDAAVLRAHVGKIRSIRSA